MAERIDRRRIVAALREIAGRLRLAGDNPFRARAYAAGAEAIEGLSDADLERRLEDRTVTALGRLILRREPIACDVDAVLDAVATSRAATEISGDPYRLDLPPAWIPAARRRGIRFVISTDAHALPDLDNVIYGVAMARRGGVTKAEVLNTLSCSAFSQLVHP